MECRFVNSERIKNKSLKKSLDIMNCFVMKPSWGITEISEYLGLNKSNVHDIVSTLTAMGYLQQDEETSLYKLGMQVFALSRALGESFSIIKIALPYMQALSNLTDQSVYLAIPFESEVVYLEATYPADSINLMRTILGERAKMHCTGIGKAILANCSNDVIENYVSNDLTSYTEFTITDKCELLRELGIIRQRGYSIDNMEHEFGIKCVAMPIFDKTNSVFAAISISGSALQIEDDKIQKWALIMKEYVRKIEDRL